MAVNSFNAQNPPVNTKGDVFTFSTIPTRLAVGANGTVLTADSAEATGLKWAAPAIAQNWTLVNSGGTALTGASVVTISGITDANQILVLVYGASASANGNVGVRINTATTDYRQSTVLYSYQSTYNSNNLQQLSTTDFNDIRIGTFSNNGASVLSGGVHIMGGNSAGFKTFIGFGGADNGGGDNNASRLTIGAYNSASTISSISVVSANNFDAGSVFVYKTAQGIK